VSAIEPKARKFLTEYYWPGNIDELKQLITDIFSQYSRITTITADDERFIGKIQSRYLRVRSTLQNHSTHQIDTREVVKIIREEDTRFVPPKMKYFALTLKDGSHLAVLILDKTIKAISKNEYPRLLRRFLSCSERVAGSY